MSTAADGGRAVDVLIVGSGPSAVNAAYPLAEAGLAVRMLDFGQRDTRYEHRMPSAPFSEIRRADPDQHRFFLGERFEGVALGRVGAGPQLTPPRQYVTRSTAELTPVSSASFFPLESLALGGLGAVWGAGCPAFTDADLDGFPFDRTELQPHYEAVAARIGISGARDDLYPIFGDLAAMQPAVDVDTNATMLLDRYRKKREKLHRAGFFLGRPRLAMLSRSLRGREPNPYHDMDFWSDRGKSVYRPRWTLEELSELPDFEYRDSLLVERFEEPGGEEVVVQARNQATGARETHRGRALVLAAGTLGTARIVLRSLDLYDHSLPLVCNPHVYAALSNLGMLGKPAADARHSMAQLCVAHAPEGIAKAATVGHLYSYRSLLLFRLVKDAPLPVREGFESFRHLVSSLTLLILQHQDRAGESKLCSLARGRGTEPDRLEIQYALPPEQEKAMKRAERAILGCFRKLGVVCLRKIRPGHAASAHYAGTFPMTTENRELTTDSHGHLRGTRNVYLADGSVFPYLPSKGPTFTLMANADRIGTLLREELTGSRGDR